MTTTAYRALRTLTIYLLIVIWVLAAAPARGIGNLVASLALAAAWTVAAVLALHSYRPDATEQVADIIADHLDSVDDAVIITLHPDHPDTWTVSRCRIITRNETTK